MKRMGQITIIGINNDNRGTNNDKKRTCIPRHIYWKWTKKAENNENKNKYEYFFQENDEIISILFRAVVLRVILTKKEKMNVERLLMGLGLDEIQV
jgi:hypothetical protein